ncbi:MAG TPA: hypothetical protein VGO67_13155 [Verrucomicrobiae bacterium]
MSDIETNIFPILNLRELKTAYRTYRILNLHKDQKEYYQNCQHLTRKLSFKMKAPIVVVEENGEPLLVVPEKAPEPPADEFVVRSPVAFELKDELIELDYTVRSPRNDAIAIRFLSFLVQTPLFNHPQLWQPGSGQAFFDRRPTDGHDQLDLFRGHSVRPVIAPTGDIGLCVDVHSKLIHTRSLPAFLTRQAFNQGFKNSRCLYCFGDRWYEIALTDFSDLSVSKHKIPLGEKMVPLFDYILEKSPKPLPPDVSGMDRNSVVVMYKDKRDQALAAAAWLCYKIVGNDDPTAQKEFPNLSIAPGIRRDSIRSFTANYLQRLRFGRNELRVSTEPLRTTPKLFQIPDLQFGCNVVLSARGTRGAVQVSLDDLGAKRLSLLKDKSAGFFEASPLDKFFFIIPQSVQDTFGESLLKSLSATMDDLFPQERGFIYDLITYPDRDCRNFPQTCDAIFTTLEQKGIHGGYSVTMLREFSRREPRKEDTSASHVIQQLKQKFDLVSSVIHTTVGSLSYEFRRDGMGKTHYVVKPNADRRLNGYLRNVSINKILLLNQKWPFVLATPLHADLVIGIDVKGNMAGFIATNKKGNLIVPFHKKSRQKERLLANQCKDYFYQIVEKMRAQSIEPVKHIVIHRDGRLFETEIEGLKLGLEKLIENGYVDADAALTFIEIPQTSPATLRLFDISHNDSELPAIQNAQFGNYYVLNAKEGFVCTTGRAFRHKGTAKPLHVIKREGALPIEKCLEDIFFLSALAWTRPEDCSRDPITTKLNDRWLGEEGADHKEENENDSDAVEAAV